MDSANVDNVEGFSDTTTESEEPRHFEEYLRARNAAENTARAALKTSQEVRRLSAHVQKCTGMYDRSVRTLLHAHEELEDASHGLVLQRARAKLAEANLRSIGGHEAIESLRETLLDGMFSDDEHLPRNDDDDDDDVGEDSKAPTRRAPRSSVPGPKGIAKDKDRDKKKRKAPKKAKPPKNSGGGVKDGGGMMPPRVFLNDASSRAARAADAGRTLDPGLEMVAHADKTYQRRRERKQERAQQAEPADDA